MAEMNDLKRALPASRCRQEKEREPALASARALEQDGYPLVMAGTTTAVPGAALA